MYAKLKDFSDPITHYKLNYLNYNFNQNNYCLIHPRENYSRYQLAKTNHAYDNIQIRTSDNNIQIINSKILKNILLNKNPLISPISVYYILCLLCLAARDTTRKEIVNTMDMMITNKQIIHNLMKINTLFNNVGKTLKINNLNLLLIKKDKQLQPNYISVFGEMLHGKIISFNTDIEAMNLTNNFVSNATHKLIPQLLGENDVKNTSCIIVNVIYFKALWKLPFSHERTSPATFYNSMGTKIIQMMHQTEHFYYFEKNFAQYLMMHYKDSNYAMVIGLPKLIDDDMNKINDYLNNIIYDTNITQNNYVYTEVSVSIPKFEHRYRANLKENFENMGIREIFTNKANLSNLTPDNNFKVDKIIHEAVVRVDEKGTEAAAATAVIMKTTAQMNPPKPIIFNADHPFYYAIIHIPSKTILFNGVYGL